jgi:aldehyde:ferredoxin oxidoreductase
VVLDSAVMCAFMPLELEQIVPLINHATGLNLDTASALKLGERISNVEKLINSREGLKRADDTLPLRLLSDSVPYCGNEMLGPVQDLSGMLDEFYEVCAWDLETGAPKSART